MRTVDRVALATAIAHEASRPYVSLALVASAADATPLLLLSSLAEHTRNIAQDARLALLYDGTQGLDDPLTGMRASVVGRAIRSERADDRTRFLARHPSARVYADFQDFAVYRVAVDRVHLVAGFGRIRWLAAAEILLADVPAGLMAQEGDILDHMNGDHAEAIGLYATAILGRTPGEWRMTGLDPEGCDLRCGGATARLTFAQAIQNPEEARATLARLAQEARTRPIR
ncbi:MAG: DUF2470 domain-containing protein [Alphaproteobacteria bacterium]